MGSLLFYFLIGLFFYWVFKSYSRFQAGTGERMVRHVTPEQIEDSQVGLFVALMAKVAKADGRIDSLEAELIGNTFTDIANAFSRPDAVREKLKVIFNREKQRTHDIDTVLLQLQNATRGRPQERLSMYAFLANLAYIDGTLSHGEEHILAKTAAFLQIDPAQADAILQRFASLYKAGPTRKSLEEAYVLLEATPDEPMQSIKKKYRALVKQYHPDLMKAKGADEVYIADATQKMQEINAAYEMIKEAR